MPDPLTLDDARRVARLARLALDDNALEHHRAQLASILNYMDQLRSLNLTNIEPMAHPTDQADRWDSDTPRDPLPIQSLLNIAPATDPPFISVPKIIQ